MTKYFLFLVKCIPNNLETSSTVIFYIWQVFSDSGIGSKLAFDVTAYLKKLNGRWVSSVGDGDVDLGRDANGFGVGLDDSELSTGKAGVLNGASVVRMRFKNEGRVRPVDDDGSEDASGVSSSVSDVSDVSGDDGDCVDDVTVDDVSVGLNRLMNGLRDLFNGLVVLELAEIKSEMEMSSKSSKTRSSMMLDVVEDEAEMIELSVLRNRFKKFGRLRGVEAAASEDGGVVKGTSVLRIRFNSTWIGVTV